METSNEIELLGSCTYSPQDDKIRIYFFSRIDKELFNQFKEQGFTWTMKQESDLVAYWTPARQDFAEKYCGQLGDEESDLLDRSADRADRFSGYLDNRLNDVQENSDNVQVIGMQSADKAESKALRIEQMRNKADLNFSKAKYWNSRIDSVISHAIFKESASLRQRRIRTLKSDCAKHQKDVNYYQTKLNYYEGLTAEEFSKVEFRDNAKPLQSEMISKLKNILENGHSARWLEHLLFRISFEEKVLISQGVVKVEADYKKFGVINGKYEIVRVNKSKGVINSLTVKNPKFSLESNYYPEIIILIENVTSYTAPDETIKREKKEVCSTLNLSRDKIQEIFGDCIIKEMTSTEYKNQGMYNIYDVKEGKLISRYDSKMKKIQGDFKIRGSMNNYMHQNERKNTLVILTDKKFNDDKVKEYAKAR